jgi:hypothetical protein
VIDAILTEVVLNESNEQLLGLLGRNWIWLHWRCLVHLQPDLLIQWTLFFWLWKQRKSAIPQVLAEAGCLLKKRLAAGPVFAVLTNRTDFRFFAIGVVYASKRYLLEIGPDITYNSSSSLSEILRWFNWFMTNISPSASSEDLTVQKIEDSLNQLRKCFGTKKPPSSKKIKIQK